jgi:hypothetical protein
MRDKDNTERREHKTEITAHAQMMLMILTLAAVIFAARYYVAAMQIAAMVSK